MTAERLPNRWVTAVAAFCMQICLGAAYGWSVFKNPLMNTEHWSETSVQLNFTITLVCLGFGTIIGGLWQDRVGPRKVASTAAVLYGLGYIVAGFATAPSLAHGHLPRVWAAGRSCHGDGIHLSCCDAGEMVP